MRKLVALLSLAACLSSAQAQNATVNGVAIAPTPQPGQILSTNAIQTCGSQSIPITTFTAANQTASLSCPGAGTYDVRIVPASGNPLVGTFTSADLAQPLAPSGRRLYKNGVGPLEITSDTLTSSNTAPITYRTNGGDNLTLTLTSYTSGSAQIYISASYTASMVLLNGSVDTREEAALRQGKAFTASTGLQVVAAGSNEELLLSNPAGSSVRLVIPMSNRIVGCNNVSSAILPQYAALPNATTNLPTTALSITRRGGTSGTSAASALGGVYATTPQTTPTTTNPIGLAFFGAYAIPQDRTLEPGNSILIYITGVAVPSGLGTTSASCSIIVSWYEESLN